MLTELHALGGPGVEVGLHVDGAGAALVLADGPVLVEGLGAVDGGLVDTLGLRNLVGRAVRGDGALDAGGRGRVVGTEVLNNVVLDKGVAGPAVDRKVGVTLGAVGTGVGDGAWICQYFGSLRCSQGKKLTGPHQGSIPFHQPCYHRSSS